MSSWDSKFIEMLTEVSRLTEGFGSARVAAAIAERGKLIALGVNRKKSHPMALRFSKNNQAIYSHAELDAIVGALKKVEPDGLRRATLYVVRTKIIRGQDVLGEARPCAGCIRAIEAFQIKRVVYTGDDQALHEIKRT